MNWKNNINSIKEIFDEHYQIILDFATMKFIPYILNDEYNFCWVIEHTTSNYWNWKNSNLPISSEQENFPVLARQIKYDLILSTEDFKNHINKFGKGIHLVQMNKIPNYYLDLHKLKGKTKYDLLKKECDYLFEIEIPGATDYGTLISSNKEFLESLLSNKEINWNELP